MQAQRCMQAEHKAKLAKPGSKVFSEASPGIVLSDFDMRHRRELQAEFELVRNLVDPSQCPWPNLDADHARARAA